VATLDLERITSRYLVARGHPAPDQIRSRLDALVESAVPDRCGRLLSQVVDESDRTVWLIREIELELFVDAGQLDDVVLARVWGEQAASAIAGRLAKGPDGRDVLRFDDRADYVAAFLVDAVQGRAWDRWFYAPFLSLRALPKGALVLSTFTTLNEDAFNLIDRLISRHAAEEVLGTLSGPQADKLHNLLSAGTTNVGVSAILDDLDIAVRAVSLDFHSVSDAIAVVPLYLALRRAMPRLELARPLFLASDLLVKLIRGQWQPAIRTPNSPLTQAHLLEAGLRPAGRSPNIPVRTELQTDELEGEPPPPNFGAGPLRERSKQSTDGPLPQKADEELVVSKYQPGRPPGEAPSSAPLEILRPIRSLRPVEQPRPREADLERLAAAARYLASGPAGIRGTSARPVHSPFAGVFLLLPFLDELGMGVTNGNAVLRLLVLVKCLGASSALRASSDFGVLTAAGVSGSPGFEGLASIEPGLLADEVVTALGRLDRLTSEWLALETAAHAVVVRDPAYGEWVHCGLATALPAVSRRVQRATGRSPIVRPAEELDRQTWPALQRPVAPDLDYLAFPSGLIPLDEAMAHSTTLIASAILRGFARRLPGFEAASARFLSKNFLSGDGSVFVDDNAIKVELGAVPLQIVLAMAGLVGRTFRYPWHAPRSVTLSFSDT